jgi:hypothetical protein
MPLEQILGGLGDFVGGFMGDGDRREAMAYLDKARNGYASLNPTIVGQETGPSAYVAADPATRAAQLDALANFQSQYKQGGLDAVTRANLAQIEQQNAQQAHAGQQAVLQGAQRRGMLNSNAALAAQQAAGQQGNQRSAAASLQAGAIGQQNRMAALQGAAGLAGGIRGQDYERAGAQDAIARFNASQRQNAAQNSFQNGLGQQQGMAGVYGAQADQKNKDAQRIQRMVGGLGRAAGGVADYATGMGGAPDGTNIIP